MGDKIKHDVKIHAEQRAIGQLQNCSRLKINPYQGIEQKERREDRQGAPLAQEANDPEGGLSATKERATHAGTHNGCVVERISVQTYWAKTSNEHQDCGDEYNENRDLRDSPYQNARVLYLRRRQVITNLWTMRSSNDTLMSRSWC